MLHKALPYWGTLCSLLMLVSVNLHAAEENARSEYNMPVGVTDVSENVFDLHMLIFYICVIIGVAVFGIMFWSILWHRKSRGVKSATFHESIQLEFFWTAIPAVILIFMVVPSIKTLTHMYNPPDGGMDIKITGYQWKWQYEYLNEDVSFFSNLLTSQDEIQGKKPKGEFYLLDVDNPLVLPVDTKIRFLVTANDVIHSWWVPDFAVKRDAIPGFMHEAWTIINEPGIYRGQCAELCGKDHGFMPVVVHAVAKDEYQRWIGEKQQQAKELEELKKKVLTKQQAMEKGEMVYKARCAACHQQNGEGISTFPALKGSAIATGDINAHLEMVINGSKTNAAMQAFGIQLNYEELAAVITYERNAWGNNTGDVVQPLDVYNFKNQSQ